MRKTFFTVLLIVALAADLGAQSAPKAKANHARNPKSEETLRFRLEINPHDETAHKELTEALRKRDAFRALVNTQATWVKNNPTDYVALIELASYSKAALYDPEFAIQQEHAFVDGVKHSADDQSYDLVRSQLASDLTKRGRPEEALDIINDLIQHHPQDVELWADRCDPLTRLGRYSEAIQSLHRALEGSPSSESLHQSLADVLGRTNDLVGAESEYRAALSLYNAKYKKGETNSSMDGMVKGLVDIEAHAHAEHVLADMHLSLATVLMREKRWNDAVAETQAALDADNTGLQAYYVRAEILDAKGDRAAADQARQGASAAVNRLVKKEKPADLDIDPRIAFLVNYNEDFQGPSSSFPTEILTILEPRIDKLTPTERMTLAETYLDLGRVHDALQQWEKALSANPKLDTASVHGLFGERLVERNAFREALPQLRRAYELDPQNLTFRLDFENTRRLVQTSATPERQQQ